MRTMVSIGIIGLFFISSWAQTASEQHWINLLKATNARSIEKGIPDQRFDQWFSALVQPETPAYEVDDCGERNGTPEEKGKQFPLCVAVTANVAPARKVELHFVVGTYIVPLDKDQPTREKPAKVAFFSGSIGPGDPHSKQPTRSISKLSEVEKLLKSNNE